jgi:hypothetical protein
MTPSDQEARPQSRATWLRWLAAAFFMAIVFFLLAPKSLVVKGTLKTAQGPISSGMYDFRLKFYDVTTRTDVIYVHDATGVKVNANGGFDVKLPGDALKVATLMQVCIASSSGPGLDSTSTIPSCEDSSKSNQVAYDQTVCGLTTVDQEPTNPINWLAAKNVIYTMPTKACGGTGGDVASVSGRDVVTPLLENPGTLGEVLSGVDLQPGTVLAIGDDGQLEAVTPEQLGEEIVQASGESNENPTDTEIGPVAPSSPSSTIVQDEPNTDSQTLSLSGNALSISGGNSVTLPGSNGSDGDTTIGNEVTDVDGSGLVRVGSGTTLDPYKVGLQTCVDGEILESNSGMWTCTPNTGGSSYLAGSGLQLSGATFSVNSPTCAGTTKLQWSGSAFVCSSDVDTTYTAGTGLSLVGTTFSNAGVLGVSGSGPITSSGGQNPTINFMNGTIAGQVWQWNGSAWALTSLPTDGDSIIGNEVTNVTGSNSGLVRSGSGTNGDPYTLAANTGSGLQIVSNQLSINSPTCGGTDKLQWNGSVFVCATDQNTTYSAITNGGLRLIGTQFGLVACSDGQLLKATATSGEYACAPDNNTTYSAGSGLSLVGTTFSNTGVLSVAGSGAITSTGGQNPTVSFVNGANAGEFWQWNGSTWALATLPTEGDGVVGNEVMNVTGSNSGLARSGSGTSIDPYTLAVSVGNGLQLVGGNVAINSPTCAGTTKLQWNGSAFVCSSDVDTTNFSITDGSTSQSVAAAQAITFSGDATTKTRVTLGGTRQLTFGLDTTGAGTGNVLTYNGSALVWQAPATYAPTTCSVSGTYFCQNGNTLGATAILGTNDAQSLSFETGNTVQMTILANGNVGIGTSPSEKLDVNGNINIPATSSIVGVIKQGGIRLIHTKDDGSNSSIFAGLNSGNLTTTGFDNVGVGSNALAALTDGFYNTAVGSGALMANTDGIYNTAIGYGSMEANTEGYYNSALGERSLFSNIDGFNNTSVGSDSLFDNTSGAHNTGLGVSALGNNDTGVGNVGVGEGSGVTSALSNGSTAGNNNTFLGYMSGLNSTTQRNNSTTVGAFSVVDQSDSLILGCINGTNGCTARTRIGIGTAAPQNMLQIDGGAGAVTTMAQFTNATTGGTSADGFNLGIDQNGTAFLQQREAASPMVFYTGGNLRVVLDSNGRLGISQNSPGYLLHVGSSSVASGTSVARFENAGGTCTVTPNTVGNISCTSDERAKRNIKDFGGALDIVNQVDVKTYNMKADPEGATTQIGVLAQQAEKVLPSLVMTDPKDGMKSFSYAGLTPILLQAIKEQQIQIDTIQKGVWSGGVVTKDTIFKKSTVFEGPVTFNRQTTFENDLEVLGKVKLSGDQVNSAVIPENNRRTKISFKGSYASLPYITATPREFLKGEYRITDVTKTGFVIELSQSQPKAVRFDWHAFSR